MGDNQLSGYSFENFIHLARYIFWSRLPSSPRITSVPRKGGPRECNINPRDSTFDFGISGRVSGASPRRVLIISAAQEPIIYPPGLLLSSSSGINFPTRPTRNCIPSRCSFYRGHFRAPLYYTRTLHSGMFHSPRVSFVAAVIPQLYSDLKRAVIIVIDVRGFFFSPDTSVLQSTRELGFRFETRYEEITRYSTEIIFFVQQVRFERGSACRRRPIREE